MRDGEGNKLSPEEEQKVKSIQRTPDRDSLDKVSINPAPAKDRPRQGQGEKTADKPATDAGE